MSFNKLYDKNYQESKSDFQWNGWTNNRFDDMWFIDVIDEGYLTHKQFCDYNNLKEIYEDELTDDEIWSMTNSNEF